MKLFIVVGDLMTCIGLGHFRFPALYVWFAWGISAEKGTVENSRGRMENNGDGEYTKLGARSCFHDVVQFDPPLFISCHQS